MIRPENPYLQSIKGLPLGAPGAWIAQAEARARTFEEGVDAGRKWGHEEKDEEWRADIRRLLDACVKETERFKSRPEHVNQVNTLLWVVAQIYHIFGEEQDD